MRPIHFCASCGSRLEEADGEGGRRCTACGRMWYSNPAPTIACVIVRDGRALVAVRAGDPWKGRIDVPGGFLNVAEQPLDGLKREVREELGVEVEVSDRDFVQAIAHRYEAEGQWLVSLGFRARLVSGEPRPADDVADIRWVTRDEIDDLDFAWPHDRVLVRRVLEEWGDEGRGDG
jgi:ADP-ribose pyrophosphatase YjhB (NUDIX family)